jgi:hypothetical protein
MAEDLPSDAEPNTTPDQRPADEFTVYVGDEEVRITEDTTVGDLRGMPFVDADPDDVLTVATDDARLKALPDDSTVIADHVTPKARLGFHPGYDKTDVGRQAVLLAR